MGRLLSLSLVIGLALIAVALGVAAFGGQRGRRRRTWWT
jgi:hypothetical protein